MDHYTRVLGVAVDWEFHGVFASGSRGKVSLFLPRIPTATCSGSDPAPGESEGEWLDLHGQGLGPRTDDDPQRSIDD